MLLYNLFIWYTIPFLINCDYPPLTTDKIVSNNETDIPFNVSYVIVPSDLQIGIQNKLIIQTRQARTFLTITLNITSAKLTFKDDTLYELNQPDGDLFIKEIDYVPPIYHSFDEPLTVKLEFDFKHCLDETCQTAINKQVIETINLVKPELIILGETEKPIYTPGQLVRARFLAINPNQINPSILANTDKLPKQKLTTDGSGNYKLTPLEKNELMKLEKIEFDEIYIIDPKNERLAQWLNANKSTISNLKYKLLNDATEGEWKIIAKIGTIQEKVTFNVRRYTLPRFTVDLKPPENLNLHSKMTEFSVCAKYTNGPPMRGYVNALLCVCPEYVWDKDYSNNKEEVYSNIFDKQTCLPSKFLAGTLRPCVPITANLMSDGCVKPNVSTELLQLKNEKYADFEEVSLLCAKVVEEGTDMQVASCSKGAKVEVKEVSLEIDMHEVYKPKLPFVGIFKIKGAEFLTKFQKQIRVLVYESTWTYYWGGPRRGNLKFNQTVQPDEVTGSVKITFPPIDSYNSLKVEAILINYLNNATSTDMEYQSPIRRYRPYMSDGVNKMIHLKAWRSVEKVNLQSWPPVGSIKPKCPGKVKLTLLANTALWNKTVYVESVVKGKHLLISLPPIRNVEDKCTDLDNEFGHYQCDNVNSNKIKCLPGWTGNDCLKAICASDCHKVGGRCSSPNECVCNNGWTGINCATCVKRSGCVHGRCVEGDDCVCDPEWEGYLCDSKEVVYDNVNEKVDTDKDHHQQQQKCTGNHHKTGCKLHTEDKSASHHQQSQTYSRTLHTRNIQFEINSDWGPKASVIIYFHMNDDYNKISQLVTTFVNIEQIDTCTSKAIEMQTSTSKHGLQFDKTDLSPGERLSLDIVPQGMSQILVKDGEEMMDELCYLRISDISLDNYDDSKNRWSLTNFADRLQQYADNRNEFMSQPVTNEEAFLLAGLRMGSSYPQMIVSIQERIYLESALSRSRVDAPLAFVSSESSGSIKRMPLNTKPRLRDFFPEVWMFETLPVKEIRESDGQMVRGINLNLTTPDSVTSWRASVLCTTKDNGVWIPDSEVLTVNMPFYIDIAIPKESKRDEVLHLPVSVFMSERKASTMSNDTAKACYEVTLTSDLDSDDWILLGSTVQTDCLCVGDKRTYTLTLIPRQIGHLNITVYAVANPNSPMCSNTNDLLFTTNEPVKTYGDQIRRSVQVLPEGIRTEINIGEILCLEKDKHEFSQTFQFVLPENIIKDSLNIYITYSREVLGTAMKNLQKLIHLPSGCGEQNMVLIAPNIFVLGYLNATGKLTQNKSDISISTLRRNIEAGYRHQLQYQRDDGSYSAFGKSDSEGSTWLTAFVLRVFSQAYKIDPTLSIPWNELFNTTFRFLVSKQNSKTGCFVEDGKLLDQSMQGALYSDDTTKQDVQRDILFTAYVVSAMQQATSLAKQHWMKDIENSINKSITCIQNGLQSMGPSIEDVLSKMHTYAIVQLTHALITIEPNSALTESLWHFVNVNKEQGSKQTGWKYFWSGAINSTTSYQAMAIAQNVEATAYAYLCYSRKNSSVESLLPIIRWLTSKQNSNGGFYSTQDTILGLEALADFATKLGLSEADANDELTIEATMNDVNYTLIEKIEGNQYELINRRELPPFEVDKLSNVTWKLKSDKSSRQCIVVQSTFMYNLPTSDVIGERPKFTISKTLSQSVLKPDNACRYANLTVCLKPTQETGMLLIEIAMITGWEPIIEQLQTQLGPSGDNLRKFEIDSTNSLALYFDGFNSDSQSSLDKQRRCVTVPLKQTIYIENAQNATITVRDYYVQESKISLTYELDECKHTWPITNRPQTTNENTTVGETITEVMDNNFSPVCPDCLSTSEMVNNFTKSLLDNTCENLHNTIAMNITHRNTNQLNGTFYQISNSQYIASWNATLDLTDLTNCTCELIQNSRVLIILSLDENMTIYPGDPVINLAKIAKHIKLTSGDLFLKEVKMFNSKLFIVNDDVNKPQQMRSNCKRIIQLKKLIKLKLITTSSSSSS